MTSFQGKSLSEVAVVEYLGILELSLVLTLALMRSLAAYQR